MGEWVESGGVRLAVEVLGEGEPVTVVAHGLTQSRLELSLFAPFVPGTKVLFDFRGHGESERPGPGAYRMDDFAADVEAVADAHGATVLIGASLGGGATLRLLRRRPDRFERMVILLPARLERGVGSEAARARLFRVAEHLERYPIEEAAERILAAEEAEGALDGSAAARELRLRALLRMNREGMPHAIRESLDDPPVTDFAPLRLVRAPVLVIGQEGDPVHESWVARELAEMLPGGELMLFPDPFATVREIPALVSRIGSFIAG